MSNMSQVSIQHFENPEKIFSYISDNLITRDQKLGFRGHASSDWELKTTLTRFSEQMQTSYHDKQFKLEELTKLTKQRLERQFINNLIVNNDLTRSKVESMDILQYGQHFGLPSPLLDWSYSPYIALFFALSDWNKSFTTIDKCIWIIDLDLIEEINDFIVREVRPTYQGKLSDDLLNEQFPLLEIKGDIEQHNRRLAFQQGFFTDHGFYTSLEIWLKRIVSTLARPNTGRPVLQKLTFKSAEQNRMNILDRLDKMNINNRTLFPDIEGSVKDAIDSTYRSFQEKRIKEFSFWKNATDE
jgi:hypothetical protein